MLIYGAMEKSSMVVQDKGVKNHGQTPRTHKHVAQFDIPQQFLKERLCMTMYDYV